MDTVEGSGRPDRREAPGNRKRFRPGDPVPGFQFGQYGELTPRAIAQAGLTGEAKKLAYEVLHVQSAYKQILDCLCCPVDPDGQLHDLSAIESTRHAIAYTLAMCGFQQTGKAYIRKQPLGHGNTWVDARLPDTGTGPQPAPPPHGVPPPDPGEIWHVSPNITYEDVPRERR